MTPCACPGRSRAPPRNRPRPAARPKLGSSTLIYAGDTLRLPGTVAGAAEEPASAGGKTGPPTPKHTTNDTDDDSGEKAADKPAMKHSKGRAAKAIAYARAQLGKPYVWG
ncbi:hypothetical protein AB4Z54_75410, partial [Streptomyces sp. MCAF7]